jgi:hypothetical protein
MDDWTVWIVPRRRSGAVEHIQGGLLNWLLREIADDIVHDLAPVPQRPTGNNLCPLRALGGNDKTLLPMAASYRLLKHWN